VAGEIRALGYNVVSQVGCSGFRIDIGVVDPAEPGRFLLGVECDGATYHSAATARDRDRLRQQILEKLGWRIHRIWSPDWVTKREGEIRRLRQAIEDARYNDGHDAELEALLSDEEDSHVQQQAPGVERVAVAHPDPYATLPGTVPYEACEVGVSYENGSEFHYPQYRKKQSELLAEVVSKEGPIHIELATKRVIAAWGLTRAGVRIIEAIAEAIRLCESVSLLEKRGDFLWPTGLNDVPVRVPVSQVQETYRDVAHIPPEEIQACMLLIIRHAVGIGADSLLKETASVFGFNRTGNRIRDRLLKECEALQQKGTITNVDGSLCCKDNQ
jgi:very-short-patch-repair endonuclease